MVRSSLFRGWKFRNIFSFASQQALVQVDISWCRKYTRTNKSIRIHFGDRNYLLECPNYLDPRMTMIAEISTTTVDAIDANTLLKGRPTLSDTENKTIFLAVQKFIGSTKRFT